MSTNSTSIIFWIISILAIIWNLCGCFIWYTEYQYFAHPELRDDLGEAFEAYYETVPSWIYIVFAIAVLTGLIGSILLVMKKKAAVTAFLISLVTVLFVQIHGLFLSGMLKSFGAEALIMPIIVVTIAVFLYFFSRSWRHKGLLT